jgi:hypothetical protein
VIGEFEILQFGVDDWSFVTCQTLVGALGKRGVSDLGRSMALGTLCLRAACIAWLMINRIVILFSLGGLLSVPRA